LSGIKEDQEQGWVLYTVAMLAVQVVSFIFTYLILRLQDHLPLNPMGFSGVAPDLAWNTTVSFVTNTNWQNCTGEQTCWRSTWPWTRAKPAKRNLALT